MNYLVAFMIFVAGVAIGSAAGRQDVIDQAVAHRYMVADGGRDYHWKN